MLWEKIMRGRRKVIWMILLQFIYGDQQKTLVKKVFQQIPKVKEEEGMW